MQRPKTMLMRKVEVRLAVLNMRKKDLAAKLTITSSTLTSMLFGNPTVGRLRELAEALSVPVDALLAEKFTMALLAEPEPKPETEQA